MDSVKLQQLMEAPKRFLMCVQMLGRMCHSVLYLSMHSVEKKIFQVVSVSLLSWINNHGNYM